MSEKPVAERLQVKRGRTLAVVDAPAGLEDVIGARDGRAASGEADVVLLFVRDRAGFAAALPGCLGVIGRDAILWVAYPKLSSPLAGDLSRDIIHALAPAHGLDAVSQITIDADWSALRLKRIA